MAVIPPPLKSFPAEFVESPVKPKMEIFQIPYEDFYEDDVIKYPLSSTSHTNSSMNDLVSPLFG